MPLEVAFGQPKDRRQVDTLLRSLNNMGIAGNLYIGYPILSNSDEKVCVDALLVSEQSGLVLFDISSTYSEAHREKSLQEIKENQDKIFALIQAKMLDKQELREGRSLVISPEIITVLPNISESVLEKGSLLAMSFEKLEESSHLFKPIPDEYIRPLKAMVERVSTLRPKNKRKNVKKADSKGAILKFLEKQIANLDYHQNKAAIEYLDGPQRIRGLAGSGKTVVLALKAAYIHALNPDWKIAVTFNSRSLYQQFRELIRRFTYEQNKDEPDWDNLYILHGWGSHDMKGMYSLACRENGIEFKNWSYANSLYGQKAFEGVCKEYLEEISDGKSVELFDVVLIDEAQDFPVEFFHLVYHLTKSSKRIVWAYDDLQNLGEYSLSAPDELFPVSDKGTKVTLENNDGEPRQDIVLPVCYRNTPWALATAHALGFGVYRDKGMVQMFDNSGLWSDIGYEVASGNLSLGENVSLRRKKDSYPPYVVEHLTPEESVVCKVFENDLAQYDWLIDSIIKNLHEDELQPNDILIIMPNAYTSKSKGARIMKRLAELEVSSHIAGVTSSADTFFEEDSITITHIYRAKGNEAPMVYIVNSEHCVDGYSLATKRNILFTAITRSRAWVRILGVGEEMNALKNEFLEVVHNQYNLEFEYPTAEQIKTIKTIHRDVGKAQQKKMERLAKTSQEVLEDIKSGEISLEALRQLLPPEFFQEFDREADEDESPED